MRRPWRSCVGWVASFPPASRDGNGRSSSASRRCRANKGFAARFDDGACAEISLARRRREALVDKEARMQRWIVGILALGLSTAFTLSVARADCVESPREVPLDENSTVLLKSYDCR